MASNWSFLIGWCKDNSGLPQLEWLVAHVTDGTFHHTLQWRHNERDGVSNYQRFECLFNRLFRRRSKKTSNLRVTDFVRGIIRSPVTSPHKGPAMRKMFPFDDVIMKLDVAWDYYMVVSDGTDDQSSMKRFSKFNDFLSMNHIWKIVSKCGPFFRVQCANVTYASVYRV